MGYFLGVDLGTTFVAAAVARDERVEMVPLGARSVVMPAAVHLQDDGVLVTGEAAARRAVSNPDRVAWEIKRRLGDPTPLLLGGAAYPVTDLLGTLLRDVLRRAGAHQDGPPEAVALTHPANWGPYRRGLFEEVPRAAGVERFRLVPEPEAAAAHYAARRGVAVGEVVAVYDFGGSTFDVTVLTRTGTGLEMLGTPEGIERLGGADLDEAVLSFVDHAAGGILADLDPGDAATVIPLARLRQDCILAKEALSLHTETVIPVRVPGRHVDVALSRSRFEELIRAQVEATIDTLSRALRSAGIPPGRLAAVLLVGGSSQVPLVPRMIEEELGCRTVVDPHPKHPVALGAATVAGTDGVLPESVRAPGPPPAPGPRAAPAVTDPAPAAPTGPGGPPGAGAPAGPPPSEGRSPPAGAPHRGRRTRRTRRGLLTLIAAVGAAAIAVLVVVLVGPPLVGGWGRPPPAASTAGPTPGGAAVAPTRSVAASAPVPSLGTAIQVGPTPTFVAVTPSGHQLYVAHGDAGVVTVVDTAVDRVTATVTVPAGPPRYLAFSPDGKRLYVSVWNDARTIAALSVVDTTTNTVIQTIPMAGRPFVPAGSPDGSAVWVPNHDTGNIVVIDARRGARLADFPVPKNPHGVSFTPDGKHAYVADQESNVVSDVDTATNNVLATVPVGTSPHSVAVHPTRPLVASVNFDSDSVTVIDTNTHQVVATVPVGRNPQYVTWSADGRCAYVANNTANTVSVLDARTFTVTATVPTGASPTSIAVRPDGRTAYVSDEKAGTLTVLNVGS